jgi:hypothetical protein
MAVSMGNILKKRRSGVGNMLSCMLGILLLFMVVYLGLDMYARMNLAIKKSRIERKYILYMETYGYLTAEKQSGLTKELSDMGVVNISYAGTTMTPAAYGQEVVLSVSGEIHLDAIAGIQGFSFIREGGEGFRIYQKSTAKNKE